MNLEKTNVQVQSPTFENAFFQQTVQHRCLIIKNGVNGIFLKNTVGSSTIRAGSVKSEIVFE